MSESPIKDKLRRRLLAALLGAIFIILCGPYLVGAAKDWLRRPQEEANKRQCIANLKTLWSASMLYAEDSNGWMPPYSNQPSTNPTNLTDPTVGLPSREKLNAALSKYVKRKSAWFCPSDEVAGQDVSTFDANHLCSSYVFLFGKPGTLRSTGADVMKAFKSLPADEQAKVRLLPEHVKNGGRPELWVLMTDSLHSLKSTGEMTSDGTHLGGRNLIYLDGHTDFSKPVAMRH